MRRYVACLMKRFSPEYENTTIGERHHVRFYAQITPAEYYDIIKNNLGDFYVFLSAVKQVLEHPEQFGLSVE